MACSEEMMQQHGRRLSEVERRFLVTMNSAFHNGASTARHDTQRVSGVAAAALCADAAGTRRLGA